MDKTEAINATFLAAVIIILLAAFLYVNLIWEEEEEDEGIVVELEDGVGTVEIGDDAVEYDVAYDEDAGTVTFTSGSTVVSTTLDEDGVGTVTLEETDYEVSVDDDGNIVLAEAEEE